MTSELWLENDYVEAQLNKKVPSHLKNLKTNLNKNQK